MEKDKAELGNAMKAYKSSEALDQQMQQSLNTGISLGLTGLVGYISQKAPAIGGYLRNR